jgi:tetratricopeptide (TPR) repeat protein
LTLRIAEWTKVAPSSTEVASPLDPQAMARLASLGYVGGDMSDESRGGPSPRKRIHLEGELLQLKDLSEARQYAEASVLAQKILDVDPGNRYALHEGGMAALLAGDGATAERLSAELTRRYPEFVPGAHLRGQIFAARKDYAQALLAFQTGLEARPTMRSLKYALSLAYIANGRPKDAGPLVEAALKEKDPAPAFWVVQALLRAIAHDDDGAQKSLKEALAHGYRDSATLQSEPMLAPLRNIKGYSEVFEIHGDRMNDARRRLAIAFGALFVVSGASALVYQVVWSRLLATVFA